MIATHDDILRLFPGIQDHTIVEILATKPSLSEVEAACLLLANQDNGLIEAKRKHGDRISRVLSVLSQAEIRLPDDNNP